MLTTEVPPRDIVDLVSNTSGKAVQGDCESVSKWWRAASHGPMTGKPSQHRRKHIPACSERRSPVTVVLWKTVRCKRCTYPGGQLIRVCFPLSEVTWVLPVPSSQIKYLTKIESRVTFYSHGLTLIPELNVNDIPEIKTKTNSMKFLCV